MENDEVSEVHPIKQFQNHSNNNNIIKKMIKNFYNFLARRDQIKKLKELKPK